MHTALEVTKVPLIVRIQFVLFVAVTQFVIAGGLSSGFVAPATVAGGTARSFHIAVTVVALLVGAAGAVTVARRIWASTNASSAIVVTIGATVGFLLGVATVRTLIAARLLMEDEFIEAAIIGTSCLLFTFGATYFKKRQRHRPTGADV